ncbi:MAG: AI-2E family transporter [Clostridia bacterium]|nr:AI-2E family transporter [Clostridia bacterium]
MKLTWKGCLKVGVTATLSLFALYLAKYYWPGFISTVSLFFGTLAPLFIGFAIAYVVNILMSSYERIYFPRTRNKFIRKTRRIVCMILAYLSVILIAGVVIGLILPELVDCINLLLDQIPDAVANLIAAMQEWEIFPPEFLESLANLNWFSTVQELISAFTGGWGDVVSTVIGTVKLVFSGAVTALLSIIFSMYLLIGKDRLRHQFVRLLDHFIDKPIVDGGRRFMNLLHDCFRRFIIGQCTEAVILGVLCTLGMLILGFPYATMIGALIAFTALIPIAGAYIGAGVGAFMIFTVSPLKALLFLVFILILQQLEGNLIYPHVVGSSIGLPGIWVLVAVTVGGGIAGVLGMLCSVPIAAAIYRLLREEMGRPRSRQRKLRLLKKKPKETPTAEPVTEEDLK